MANLDMAEELEPHFRGFHRTELRQIPGGEASPDFLILTAELSELELEEEQGEGEAYHTDEPPQSFQISFPSLLSWRDDLIMSREELELEIALILEMRVGDDLDMSTAMYSVASLGPLPFSLSADDSDELSELPGPAVSNARAGYLIHEDLYALQSDPNKLHDLVSVFLWKCDKVEIKLKRRDDSTWRRVEVHLTD